ncbi:Protein I'm not dead yet [Trachymyrmex septentrionalis]|uniref:Protein I'm not dead yet n=1 Tax=Trachymyrmex septentrionalis TaxID=34720 RepID=A0A151JZP1_9HYME|nr:Protein I'm not dead yet [Trachymyrmex septentrionalis]
MELHPMYLMIPATLMCSFSFRLPVGTPPNAIVTIAGHIPTNWLIIGGCAPAMYSLLVEIILFPTWGVFVYGIKDFPDWARHVPVNNTDVFQLIYSFKYNDIDGIRTFATSGVVTKHSNTELQSHTEENIYVIILMNLFRLPV